MLQCGTEKEREQSQLCVRNGIQAENLIGTCRVPWRKIIHTTCSHIVFPCKVTISILLNWNAWKFVKNHCLFTFNILCIYSFLDIWFGNMLASIRLIFTNIIIIYTKVLNNRNQSHFHPRCWKSENLRSKTVWIWRKLEWMKYPGLSWKELPIDAVPS